MKLIYHNLKWVFIFIAGTLLVVTILASKKPKPLPDLHTMASNMVMIGINIQDFEHRPQPIIKSLHQYPFAGVILYD